VPGGELVVRHEASLKTRARQSGEAEIEKHTEARTQHKHLHQAIHNAFKAAGRRLQDYARRQRGDTKKLKPLPVAKVTQLFPEKGHGFLITPEGREIYFHKDSVLNRAFTRLKVGTAVTFAEEQGDKGPQASTVRITARRGIRQAAKHTAA
jgi:cold shock CspA family protein